MPCVAVKSVNDVVCAAILGNPQHTSAEESEYIAASAATRDDDDLSCSKGKYMLLFVAAALNT